jgi:hypothetical protein
LCWVGGKVLSPNPRKTKRGRVFIDAYIEVNDEDDKTMRLQTFRRINILCGACFFFVGLAVFGISGTLEGGGFYPSGYFNNQVTLEILGLAITVISFFYVLFTLNANVTDDTTVP